jgi:BirA family biotin operon repressor/biotin-[acetyl-CoA-carboxylase] ligase
VYDVVSGCLPQGRSNSPPLAGGVRGGGHPQTQTPPLLSAPLPNPPRKGEGIAPVLPYMGSSIILKWPNDVLVNDKKISGILAEVVGNALIIGIGLNAAHHPDAALYPATSLAAESAGEIEFSGLLDALLERLGHWHDVMQNEGFAPVRAAWLARAQRGDVTARLPHETLQGRFGGIDERGRLRLILADGAERAIATGDVVAP